MTFICRILLLAFLTLFDGSMVKESISNRLWVPSAAVRSVDDIESRLVRTSATPDPTLVDFTTMLESMHSVEPFRILLLGASGSGKTALLDLIGNLPKLAPRGVIPTRAQFNWRDLDRSISIAVPTNELPEQSATNTTTTYSLRFGRGLIEIIDTPGMGDTKGMQQDQKNVDNIVESLRLTKRCNMVVMISMPEARATATLEYAKSAINQMMPKAFANNTVALFTHTQRCKQLPKEVKSLLTRSHAFISETFCIENPMPFLDACLDESELSKKEDVDVLYDLVESSASELFRMIRHGLSSMPSVETRAFSELRGLRHELFDKLVTSSNMMIKISAQRMAIKELEGQIKTAVEEKQSFSDFVFTENVLRWEMSNVTGRKTTVCMGVGLDGTACHSNCHLDCQLPAFVGAGHDSFRYCGAFVVQPGQEPPDASKVKEMPCLGGTFMSSEICMQCKHGYDRHLHQSYEWIQVSQPVEAICTVKKAKYLKAISDESKFNSTLAVLEGQVRKLDSEFATLLTSLSALTTQFHDLSLADSLGEYLRHVEDVITIQLDSKDDAVSSQSKAQLRIALREVQTQRGVCKQLPVVHR